MTEDELLELSALVARIVFKEPKPPHPGNDWYVNHPGHSARLPGLASEKGCWFMTTDSPDHNPPKRWGGWQPRPYATRIEFAWEVVVRMGELGFTADIQWKGKGRTFEMFAEVSFYGPGTPADTHPSTGTAPEAICLAAVRAVDTTTLTGHSDEEGDAAEAEEGDGSTLFYCQNCNHTAEEVDFWPSDGNPAPHVCPKCSSAKCFAKE